MHHKSLPRVRSRAFKRQHGRCFYCSLPMWIDDAPSFSQRYGILLRQAAQFRSTAEHLKAWCDGGSNERKNIVAACFDCNTRRHRRKTPPSPERWRMIQLARRAKWEGEGFGSAIRPGMKCLPS